MMDIVIAAVLIATVLLAYVLVAGPAVLDGTRDDWDRDLDAMRHQGGQCDG